MTINGDKELIERFILYGRRKNWSENTLKVYRRDLLRFVEKHPGLLTIQPPDIDDWMISEIDRGQSPGSICRRLATIKSFYKWAISNDYLKVSPARKAEAPKKPKQQPVYLKDEELDRIIESTNNSRDKLIMEMLYATGARVSELSNMDKEDVDIQEGWAKIRKGKGDKERFVPFDERVGLMIDEYLKSRKDENPALFVSRYGKRLSTKAIQDIIKKAREKAGIVKKCTPHKFRHSLATHMIQNGADLRYVQEILGHSNISTTQIYTHLNHPEVKRSYLKYKGRKSKGGERDAS